MMEWLGVIGIVGIHVLLGVIIAYTASAFRPPEKWPLWVSILLWPVVVVIVVVEPLEALYPGDEL